MDPYFSQKIGILRFVAVVSVVVFHAFAHSNAGDVGAFVSMGLMRWALPFLGLVSGYLFFRTLVPSAAGFVRKLRTRARTILVPFLVWSGYAVLFAALAGDPRFGGPIESVGDAVYHWLVRPVAPPLWFLQALMACAILSPLVYLAVRALRGWVLLLAAIWWATGMQPEGLEQFVSARAFPPFIVGAAIALLGPEAIGVGWARRRARVPLALVALAAWVAGAALFAAYGLELGPWMRAALLPVVVLGAVAVWTGYDALALILHDAPRVRAPAVALAPLAFFVYVTQQPQLRAIMVTLQEETGVSNVAVYLLAPLLTVAFSLAAAFALRRLAPRAFALAAGGRAASVRSGRALDQLAPNET